MKLYVFSPWKFHIVGSTQVACSKSSGVIRSFLLYLCHHLLFLATFDSSAFLKYIFIIERFRSPLCAFYWLLSSQETFPRDQPGNNASLFLSSRYATQLEGKKKNVCGILLNFHPFSYSFNKIKQIPHIGSHKEQRPNQTHM